MDAESRLRLDQEFTAFLERLGSAHKCYLCHGAIRPDDPIARAHELVIHRACYERDLKRGRRRENFG